MINDLKRMNALLLFALAALFALNIYISRELSETIERADDLAAQVYTLGSMLGERQSQDRAEMTISEVAALD